jgi:Na+/proline symporter
MLLKNSHNLNTSKLYIIYCSLAGFIAAWAISGLLTIVDITSQTPPGTFFGVIGISLGFYDPTIAQYVGFILHLLTGLTAGNIFGQISLFWKRLTPYNSRHGVLMGMVVGILLWTILFLPLATFVIQPRLDTFTHSLAPSQYVYTIAYHFQNLYYIIIGGSFMFHLVYGALLGFIAGRMSEVRTFQQETK